MEYLGLILGLIVLLGIFIVHTLNKLSEKESESSKKGNLDDFARTYHASNVLGKLKIILLMGGFAFSSMAVYIINLPFERKKKEVNKNQNQ